MIYFNRIFISYVDGEEYRSVKSQDTHRKMPQQKVTNVSKFLIIFGRMRALQAQ
jgi:hypothetical protein